MMFILQPIISRSKLTASSYQNNIYGLDYYQNEQTYLSIITETADLRADSYVFDGEYLFNNGFFIGLFYFESDYIYLIYKGNLIPSKTNIVTPGYRYNIDDHTFAAVSLDYHNNNQDNGFSGVNFQFKYNPENMKIAGAFYIPVDKGSFGYSLGGDYRINNVVTAGADYANYNSNKSLSGGVTCTVGPFIANAATGNYNSSISDYTYYQVGGVYQPGDLGIGITYNKKSDYSNPGITVQAKYIVENVKVVLEYIWTM